MFSSSILEACCKQYFPHPATEIALFDFIRLMPPVSNECMHLTPLLHSVLVCGITEDFTTYDKFQAIVVESFLRFDEQVIGLVREEMMQEFYESNRTSEIVNRDLPGFILGGFLGEDRRLAEPTFARTDGGKFLEAAFGDMQIAAVGDAAVRTKQTE